MLYLYIDATGVHDNVRWPSDDARNPGSRLGGLYTFDDAETRENVKKACERTLTSLGSGLTRIEVPKLSSTARATKTNTLAFRID